MTESQNIEYKSVWRDEYLKWICGFANANGGKLFIGIDDKGQVVGVKDALRLMEDIPNKVVQHLGLAVDANLVIKGDKQIIEIVVSPSSLPVSYHGVFHYRSGNTKQELKGAALNNFLLRKMGKTWEVLKDNGKGTKLPETAMAGNPTCIQCKTSDHILTWKFMGEKGGKFDRTSDVNDVAAATNNPVGCIHCHDPHGTQPRVVRDGLIHG